ncbi:MAG: MBL fold metallo-hydrolase [Myxococcales bacterium]
MRNGWCALLLAVVAPSVLAAEPADQGARDALTAYRTVKVADGIYAFMPLRTDTPMVSGNSVAVIGEAGVLVVDSGHYPSATRRMIGEIRALSNAPVRYLVNTHWHGDHIRGNAVYREAFPAVAIVSTSATARQFDNELSRDEVAIMRKQLQQAREMLASGKAPSGAALTDRQRAMFEEAARELELMQPDIAQAKTTPPSVTFEDRLTIHLGDRDVQVLFLGRGNTAGDAVVYVPDAKVLITGDLVVHPAPYAFGSFIGEWGPTMRKLIAIDAAAIVPGHGPVMHDKAYLALVADTLESVSSQVRAAAKEGLSLDEARKKLDVERFRKQFAKGDERKARAFDGFFLGPGLPRAYREAKEGPLQDES